jgi:hypothetical protein
VFFANIATITDLEMLATFAKDINEYSFLFWRNVVLTAKYTENLCSLPLLGTLKIYAAYHCWEG